MITTDKINIIKDAMTVAANKMSNRLPEQQLLRLGAAMIDRIRLIEETAAQIHQEEVKGPTATFITLTNEWVDHLDRIRDLHETMHRQFRAIRERDNQEQAVA